ncbi:hypothetical protein [Ferrimonas pelagia]|uniref:Haemolysin activator HlyB C-terminal domain-containing protein n=1 Tax=Ferrimonas pelagia TaxID=1177826 RepID=A0ABP9EFG4_9GAMM
MGSKRIGLIALGIAPWLSFKCVGAEQQLITSECLAEHYQVVRNDVFDPDAEGYTWLHHWANRLHITTQEVAVNNSLGAFLPCPDDADDLYEIERHLRSKPYLRDAQVSKAEQGKPIKIETWDTWSLLPTIDFSRKGGENAAAMGIKDSNFLGLGIHTELLYFSDYLRSGYLIDLYAPLYLGKNLQAGLTLADTDDGEKIAVSLVRPFVSHNSQHGFGVYFNKESRNDTIRQAGKQSNQFHQRLESAQLWYGQPWVHWPNQVLRWQVGLSHDQHRFAPTQTTRLPDDRQRTYPWAQLRFQQDRYEKRRNLFLINAAEDINLGWDLAVKAGWDLSGDGGWVTQLHSHRGWAISPKHLWLSRYWLQAEQQQERGDYLWMQWRNELFYQLSQPVRLYAKIDWRHSINSYLDRPNTLGGTTGLRGYPLQYQHGDTILLASAEARYYPNINLWQLLEAGAALFYDIGEARGGSPYPDNPTGTLQSVGIGLRFYASHAGSNNVIHLDFARPISDDEQVNQWEWRVEVKQHF